MQGKQKPSIDEVLKYATPQVKKFIGKLASELPVEQRDEIEQEAYIRLLNSYAKIEPEKGWKSFVYNHCRGAVLDYLNSGTGFHENRDSIKKAEEHGSRNVGKIRDRVSLHSHDDGEDIDVDQILGNHGVFALMDSDTPRIKWDLVASMASQDELIHAFAKHLRGVTLEDMAPVFGLCRARVGQLIEAFIARFDDPELADCPWFKQTCYAFDLCRHLGMPDVDQSDVLGFKIGWGYAPVDLDSEIPCQHIRENESQMSFFSEEEA